MKSIILAIFLILSSYDLLANQSARCLKSETANEVAYKLAIDKISKIKEVKEFQDLLNKRNENLPAGGDRITLSYMDRGVEIIENKCFYNIDLKENHPTHIVQWRSFIVSVDGKEVYEYNTANDSFLNLDGKEVYGRGVYDQSYKKLAK